MVERESCRENGREREKVAEKMVERGSCREEGEESKGRTKEGEGLVGEVKVK